MKDEPQKAAHQLDENEKSLTVKSGFYNLGGGKRDRTADLLHAMQALYQLSYTPVRDVHIISIF